MKLQFFGLVAQMANWAGHGCGGLSLCRKVLLRLMAGIGTRDVFSGLRASYQSDLCAGCAWALELLTLPQSPLTGRGVYLKRALLRSVTPSAGALTPERVMQVASSHFQVREEATRYCDGIKACLCRWGRAAKGLVAVFRSALPSHVWPSSH